MPTELFANSPVPGTPAPIAVLRAPITTIPAPETIESYAVSASAPAGLQSSSGQFRVLVGSEIMLVSAKVDGVSPWSFSRAAEGSSPAAHPLGAPVFHVPTAGALTALQAQAVAAAATAADSPPQPARVLKTWTVSEAYAVASVTRDSNRAIATASVIWPDGLTGAFTTDTPSTEFPGAIDAYHVTYVWSGGSKTITQAAVTRDALGAVTAQPEPVVT